MWLTIRSGDERGRSLPIEGDELVIGREETCDLVLDDARVSRRHASLKVLEDGRVELTDLGSGNGMFVNGERVPAATLAGGEQIQLGDTVLATSRSEPGATGSGETMIGAAPPERSQSAVFRLVAKRSRRATILSAAAVAVAVVIGALFVSGVLSPDGGSSGSEDVQRVIREVTPSTVRVEGQADGRPAGAGSGLVLDAEQGLVMTNAHVVSGASTFTVGLRGEVRPAEVVGMAPCDDLAVLKVGSNAGLRTLPLGDQSKLELGDTVVAVGYPRGAAENAALTSTTGVVSVVRSDFAEPALDIPRYPNVVQTDAAINPGNSGGPLLGLDGRLVGVNSAGRTLSPDGRIVQGQNYAIGVDRVKEVARVLREGRSLGWTGLSFEYPTAEALEERRLPPGLLVSEAVRGTSADAADLPKGAVVVGVNGGPVDNSLASYCAAVKGLASGEEVTLSVVEEGADQARDVALKLE